MTYRITGLALDVLSVLATLVMLVALVIAIGTPGMGQLTVGICGAAFGAGATGCAAQMVLGQRLDRMTRTPRDPQ